MKKVNSRSGKDLVTIIIPCFNAVKYTKYCIKSILEFTTSPYELVLIDNGSTDSTADYLRNVEKNVVARGKYKPERMEIVINNKNIGVAGALNRGIELSKGKYVCYLNSDVIVTVGWLEGLIRCAESDKKIGVIGCSANPGTNEPLFFTGCPGYRDFKDIQRTAIAVSMIRKGMYVDVDIVHGLCMFIKREVIDRIGLFDERFYPCGREDIDYAIRAKKAGYRVVDAMDVFVFHFYSRSTTSKEFKKTYGDIDDITEIVREQLREKMGWKTKKAT